MKYKKIIAKLSLEQKCALLSGADVFKTRAFPHAGIPAVWLSDGPHGLRKQSGASDHLGLNPSEPATCFPTASAVGCSFDVKLGEEIGAALAEEAACRGVNVILGPGLNIKRSPLCGRNFEYFSEDPYLSGKLAAGYVRGIQKNGLAACPKHFAVNNQETRRMASDSIVDERTLREIYLTGFEIVVRESAPKSIMSSYNLINGVYANENEHLLTDILKKEWGFRGAVVTDWGGSNDHALGVKAGSALEMPAAGWDSVRELKAAVKKGKITEADVDARAEELLELIFTTDAALKEAKGRRGPEKELKKVLQKNHKLAYRAAVKCLTLLKNENHILPLAPGVKVAVIGDFAKTPRYQGAGSSQVNVPNPHNLLERIESGGLDFIGYAQGFHRLGGPDEALKKEAVSLAGHAEAVILCLGLDEVKDSEGIDRGHMKLGSNQTKLLHEIAKVNPNVIVVLFGGSAVETPWRGECRAILYAALGGQAGADAVADALSGKVNPGGKLAETWPEKYEDTPAANYFPGKERTAEYREGIYVGYRYYQKQKKKTAFPFGFGLSYTEFLYSDLKADRNQVTFTLTNTGGRDGAEIAQLYVAKPESEIFRADRELKGFARVELKAGESKSVTILLDDKAFRYWNKRTGRWETEGGEYLLQVGSSSEKLLLSAAVVIEGAAAPAPYDKRAVPHYQSGNIQDVPDREFEALLGRDIPVKTRKIDRNMTFGEMKYARSPLGFLACALLSAMLRSSLKKGRPDLNLLFLYNMPLRAVAKMTNGMVSMGMVDGMVMELKGFWLIGLVRILFEFLKNLALNFCSKASWKRRPGTVWASSPHSGGKAS